jgi:hypothetical protein
VVTGYLGFGAVFSIYERHCGEERDFADCSRKLATFDIEIL